jgi:hypothetical protein
MKRNLIWIIAGPCLVLALMSAWWTAGRLAGDGLWPPDEVTLSEAMATRNNAEAVRLIEGGADPNQPSDVRDGLLTNGYAVTIKPIEAAVGAQRADAVRTLLANGAAVDQEELRVLRCLEKARPDAGVRELLAAQNLRIPDPGSRLPDSDVDCNGVRSPLERVH